MKMIHHSKAIKHRRTWKVSFLLSRTLYNCACHGAVPISTVVPPTIRGDCFCRTNGRQKFVAQNGNESVSPQAQ